jgi:hypothetical protein
MKSVLKAVAASALLALGTTIAIAQTDSPSKAEKGAPDQGPGSQAPKSDTGTGTRPMGPPASQEVAPGKNPTGQTVEKKKSEGDDPRSGGVPAKK